MKFSVFGHEFDVTLPADPVAFVKEKVIMLLNYMGYEWPVTDTGMLDAWANQWRDLQGTIQSHLDELERSVANLEANNQGQSVEAVAAYFRGDSSNMHSLKTVAAAAPIAAKAYVGASLLVTGLRAYVIGQILMDAVSIAAAIISGGPSAAVSLLAKQGAKAAINMAIDQAINELLGA